MQKLYANLVKVAAAIVLLIGVGTAAHAVNVSCNNIGTPADVDGTLVVTCGGITFDQFQVIQASPNPPPGLPNVDLVSATFNAATGVIDLGFNPNVNLPAGGTYDVQITYRAQVGAGLIISIDGSIGGSFSSMVETVCTGGVALPGGGCTGQNLATVTVFSTTPNQPIVTNLSMPTGGDLFIFKDVNTSCVFPSQCPTGAALSSFGQSWHTRKVPEPASMLLFGLGLVGLGIWGRKRLGK